MFDLGRFGIQFVASPRHADGVLVTGPVTENMRLALARPTTPSPAPEARHRGGRLRHLRRAVRREPGRNDGPPAPIPVVPVDLFIPGCPPHPLTILDGLLRLLGRVAGDELRLEGTGIVGS